ncbi:MAG: CBS domain-containing protein [Ardenticatenaceae bacterium]|nr:CBS domain-containing protein [Ardenticatenaceae bacterium]
MLVAQRMTRNPMTITPETAVSVAISLMAAGRIHHLPVVTTDNHLIGIVSDRDLRLATRAPVLPVDDPYASAPMLTDLCVGDVMTETVVTVAPGTTLLEASQMMRNHRISCLPVLLDDQLVGIITKTDLFYFFLELLETRGARLFWDY